MELEEFYNYKNRLMQDLCSDAAIVKLVTLEDNPTVPATNLIYDQVFPYQYVPETEEEGRTFICFDVDILSAPNKTFYYPALYVWGFTHKSKFRTPDGKILIDQLSVEINRILNGNRFYGLGDLRLDSVLRFSPNKDYLGRALTYLSKDFNRLSGMKAVPNNRRLGI